LVALVRALVDDDRATRPLVLGICLGLQVLVTAFGGRVARARAPVHGKTSLVHHDGTGLFRTLSSPMRAMRYHSLVAALVPQRFRVTARDDHDQPMAIADDGARVHAVQFHPESIGTEGGLVVCANALALAGGDPVVVHRRGGIPAPRIVGPELVERSS
jgi:anthranilate/para-aminobenzoate synthase component II